MLKVLYLYAGAASPVTADERKVVEAINGAGKNLSITFWDWSGELGLGHNPSVTWAHSHRRVLDPFYSSLMQRSPAYDVILISQTGGLIPEVMADLKPTVVYNTADDPDSSASCSFPFLRAADVIAHAGVCFDERRTMADAFYERGARRCIHFPIGFYEHQFPPVNDFERQFARRDINLAYIGHPKRGKTERLMRRLPDLIVHGRSLKLKHKLYLLACTRKWVMPLPTGLHEFYSRLRVGINMHFTFGPSNVRCYQLPASGVAQVLDCPEGASALFTPGEEVLIYHSEEEAVHQIERLLADEQLRFRIAKNGYLRARSQYGRRHTLTSLLRSIC